MTKYRQKINIPAILIAILLSAFSFQLSAHADFDISAVERPFMEGRYEKAVQEAQRLIDERARQRHEVYYLKGLSELKLNRFKDARQSFEAITSKYKSSNRAFDANVGIGDSYLLEGDTASAARAYNEIKEKFPSDKNIVIVDSRLADCNKNVKPVAPPPPAEMVQDPANGHFSVQVGSFKNKRNAEKLSAKLSSAGYDSHVKIPTDTILDRLYRVRVGKFTSKADADAAAAKLNKSGYKTKICDETSP